MDVFGASLAFPQNDDDEGERRPRCNVRVEIEQDDWYQHGQFVVVGEIAPDVSCGLR